MTTTISPRLMIVMGVSGCGKSTIASQLAAALKGIYLDADDYHPKANVLKMSRGEALQDEDRWPWLRDFSETMAATDGFVVGACSALRKAYREVLTQHAKEPLLFIHLQGDKAVIRQRMQQRENHYMPESLLDSQFATLEMPDADEACLSVNINLPADEMIQVILQHLKDKDTSL